MNMNVIKLVKTLDNKNVKPMYKILKPMEQEWLNPRRPHIFLLPYFATRGLRGPPISFFYNF